MTTWKHLSARLSTGAVVATWKDSIFEALALHKSMALSGEQPTEASNAAFDKAMLILNSLDTVAVEAISAVETINEELDNHFYSLRVDQEKLGEDQEPTPSLSFSYHGTCMAVLFEGFCIWDSENDSRWVEDASGKEVQTPLEEHLRQEMAKRVNTIRNMPL